MTEKDQTVIPARKGVAVRMERNQVVRIINTHGEQVVDTWAFNSADLDEFMSMEPVGCAWTASCSALATVWSRTSAVPS